MDKPNQPKGWELAVATLDLLAAIGIGIVIGLFVCLLV